MSSFFKNDLYFNPSTHLVIPTPADKVHASRNVETWIRQCDQVYRVLFVELVYNTTVYNIHNHHNNCFQQNRRALCKKKFIVWWKKFTTHKNQINIQ